ncbi:MAG: insulinase family protein [Candidatus Delongbacteria bacterium]
MQKYETGNIYHGFKLKRSEFKQEMNSQLMMFEHEKTGARLVAVKNDDDNKTFCIAFRTIPEDCTGVAHILEHSVLSGSEKYPVKDVFSELYKGGLSTFMNAFTTPDSTYYPYSTRNNREYFNFMSVYLDTTLRPLLKKHTFLQEGWHYDIKDENSPVEYQGIVYNEMKGAMSNPLRQMSQNISKTLLPCSTYSFNSGGDPEKIPQLTYQYLLDFHKKYYHPSNSLTYLYGNADTDKELKFINDNYFKNYERSDFYPEIRCSVNIPPMHTKTYYYAAGESESLAHKTYIAISTKISTPDDVKLNIAVHLLTNILFNSEASPLKRAIISSAIAEDFAGDYDDSQYETILTAFVSGSDPDKLEDFKNIYYDVLNNIVREGLDKDLIVSELNQLEFRQNEKSISAIKGLIYMNRIMNLGLYGLDIYENIDIGSMLDELRKKAIGTNYLEKVIKNHFFDEERTAVVIMEPRRNIAQEKNNKEKERLKDYKNSLSDREIKKLVADCRQFKKEQQQKNSEEDILKIPKLEITDIDKRSEFTYPEIERSDGIIYYQNELFTNDIVYLSLGFDLSKIPVHLLKYLGILHDIFKEIGTKERPSDLLTKQISSYFGSLELDLVMIESIKDKETFRPVLYVEVKALKQNMNRVAEILSELINYPDLDNIKRISEVIKSRHISRAMRLKSEGYGYSVTRLQAAENERGKFLDLVKGLSFYEKSKELYNCGHDDLKKHMQHIKELSKMLFNKRNLHVGIISDSEGINISRKYCKDIISSLSNSHLPDPAIRYPEFRKNEAFLTTSDIVFNTLGGNYIKENAKYSGKMEVIKNYLSSDYLFEEIRLKGGAYGVWVSLNPRSGFLSMTSYRDPNVRKTFDAFRSIPAHLKNFSMNTSAFANIKIGAYSVFDPLMSPYIRGKKSREDYLSGVTTEYIEQKIEEILATTQDDIRRSASEFEDLISNSSISSIGNAESIKEDSSLFARITKLT